jgi:DNA-binding NtrC family response regulator
VARILIVDDERLIQQLLSQLLKEDGHSCETAGNVAEGRRAMEGGQVFDLVFCDVDMPDGSGLDLVKEMRGDGNDLPVVMMSGVHDASLAARAVDLGVEGYMLKPFPLEDVRERVAKILGPSV